MLRAARLSVTTLLFLAAPLALAQTAPTSSTAPASTNTAATLTLKLDAVPVLKATRVKLDGSYTTLKNAAKGKSEWREAVVVFAAADAARKAGDTASYTRLADEANKRFDAANTLAGGGTAKTSGLDGLSADLQVGKYFKLADGATLDSKIAGTDKLFTTPTAWGAAGFEPVSF